MANSTVCQSKWKPVEPSQRHIVKPQPPGETVIESEARTAVLQLKSEA